METYMELYRCRSRASLAADRRDLPLAGDGRENSTPAPAVRTACGLNQPVAFDRRILFVTSIEVLSEQ